MKKTARRFANARPSQYGDFVLKKPVDKTTRDTHERALPAPTGQAPFRLDLQDVLKGTDFADHLGVVEQRKRLVFHLSGDTGSSPNSDNRQQLNVIDGMESQFTNTLAVSNPAFFYSCGDCIYFNGQGSQYRAQFYEPYEYYPAPVLAIPGNHDGENLPGSSSLDAFVENFCAKTPVHLPEAGDIPRTAMTQPNVYFTLMTPLARIIGLYTNVNPGGAITEPQYSWLVGELQAAQADPDRAVILTMHHPIYSLDDYHSGSPHVQEPVMKAIKASGRYPDLIIGAHVHNMQRFTVPLPGGSGVVPYLVAGTGGYNNLHKMQKNVTTTGTPFSVHDDEYNVDVTLESYSDDHHGFWRFEVTPQAILGEYYTVPRPQDPYSRGARLFDRFNYDWKAHTLQTNPLQVNNISKSIATPARPLRYEALSKKR